MAVTLHYAPSPGFAGGRRAVHESVEAAIAQAEADAVTTSDLWPSHITDGEPGEEQHGLGWPEYNADKDGETLHEFKDPDKAKAALELELAKRAERIAELRAELAELGVG